MDVTAYEIAERFIGVKETPGIANDPQVMAMLRLDAKWVERDETPWCSAFANYVCWLLRLPRSKSLAARSWLTVGLPILLDDAEPGFDVVILTRGSGKQPGPTVLKAPGHVGFFCAQEGEKIWMLGGNQSDAVTVAPYSAKRVLGVRRLLL